MEEMERSEVRLNRVKLERNVNEFKIFVDGPLRRW